MRESAADLVSKIFPVYSVDELMKGLEDYQDMVLKFGITTAHDAYLDAGSNETEAYRRLEKNKKLKMRFRASLYIDPDKGTDQIKSLIDERKNNNGDYFKQMLQKFLLTV